MADRFTTPLYELFASLGLDTSGLHGGMADAEVDLREFQRLVQGMADQVSASLKTKIDPAIAGVATAMNTLEATGLSGTAAINELGIGIDKLVARQERFQAQSEMMKERYIAAQKAMKEAQELWLTGLHGAWEGKQLISLGNEDIVQRLAAHAELQRSMIEERTLQAESDAALKESVAQRVAAIKEEQAADREYLQLKAQISAESIEAAALKARLDKEEIARFWEIQAFYDQQVAATQARLAAEAASRAEYANLVKQLEAEQLAAEEEEFAGYMAMLAERLAASKAAHAEERYLLQQELYARRQAAAEGAAEGIGGFASVGIRAGAGGIYPSIRAGITGLGGLIEPLFPILLAGAFVDILAVEGKKVIELTEDWEGFGKEQKKAWDLAFDGAERSRIELIKVTEAWRELNAAGLKGSAKEFTLAADKRAELADTEKQLRGQKELQTVLDTAIGRARMVPSSWQSSLGAITYVTDTLVFHNKTLAELEKERAEVAAKITDLTKLEGEEKRKIIEDTKKGDAAADKHQQKMHDRVHEYSERLPWFMGMNPAISMMEQLSGPGPQPVRSIIGGRMPQAPPASEYRIPRTGGSAAASVVTTPGSSGGVTIHNTYSPVFKFDGIPADIVSFMRDKAEPMLVEDMQKNARGFTDRVIKTLRERGVRVG